MNSSLQRLIWLGWSLLAINAAFSTVEPAAAEPPAGLQILADNLQMETRPAPLISPDGRHVAYVSRGNVCVADVAAGTSRPLAELPGTWSYILAQALASGAVDSPESRDNTEKHQKLRSSVTDELGDFQWTADSKAIVYSLTHRVHDEKLDRHVAHVHVWRAPLDGEAKEIADGELPYGERRGLGGRITRDGRFLVNNRSGRQRALIWDVARNKPRATPYDYLAPSPTSGRWIGVEKDTRQLVALDEDFNVIARHEEYLPQADYGFDMTWSPDERFILWRQKIGVDYTSNWVGCRYDLQTHDRQIFHGDYWNELFAFTGHRGEFLRIGSAVEQLHSIEAGKTVLHSYIGLIRDGQIYMQRLWSSRAGPQSPELIIAQASGGSPISWSPDLQLFTIGLTDPEPPYRATMYLADRRRQLWRVPGIDAEDRISPQEIVGFALDGQTLIARDETRLFAIPITAIRTTDLKFR
ncbi:hypothetical protein [Lacipirellula sp.]|uniref:hypothetical protein n=1 Tax=Lacipirellula sp. TaxID=2691419 RepID=UPI003D0F89DD